MNEVHRERFDALSRDRFKLPLCALSAEYVNSSFLPPAEARPTHFSGFRWFEIPWGAGPFSLLGRTLRVLFGDDKSWFRGTLVRSLELDQYVNRRFKAQIICYTFL